HARQARTREAPQRRAGSSQRADRAYRAWRGLPVGTRRPHRRGAGALRGATMSLGGNILVRFLLSLALVAGGAATGAADEMMALASAPGRAAIGVGRPDSAAASAAARATCGAACRILAVAPAGTCVALAREQGPSLGMAVADSEQQARDVATGACRDGNRRR